MAEWSPGGLQVVRKAVRRSIGRGEVDNKIYTTTGARQLACLRTSAGSLTACTIATRDPKASTESTRH